MRFTQLNCATEPEGCMHSYILQHAAKARRALLHARCRLVSVSLFLSSMLSTMLGVVSTDIFPWSAVSTHKSQLCCQNIRAASAVSICKVSSRAIASSRALQYPMIFSCLWPFSSTKLFLFYCSPQDYTDLSLTSQYEVKQNLTLIY